MSKWNMDPETVYIDGGSIEVHTVDRVRVTRDPDGGVTYSDPLHVAANVRVFLHGEDGFFAFNLSPAQARALAASVDRHCPDAETMPLILPEDEYALVRRVWALLEGAGADSADAEAPARDRDSRGLSVERGTLRRILPGDDGEPSVRPGLLGPVITDTQPSPALLKELVDHRGRQDVRIDLIEQERHRREAPETAP